MRDSTPEEIETLEKVTKTKKPLFKEGIEWLSEIIQTEVLYRIKGKQGLFTPVTKPNKGNLLRMVRFMSNEAYTVNKSLLEGLGSVAIYTEHGKDITLSDAFDNLQKHFDNQPTGEIKTENKHLLMEIICPDYDHDRFKDYHAKKIIQWYNEIITAINTASN